MSWIKWLVWVCSFLSVALGMVWIWWNFPVLITIPFPELDNKTLMDKGVFGDMFGSLNALFSGIALVGVIFAVFMQRQELRLQSEDLRRSVEAQEISSEALRNQLKEMQEQNELQVRPFVIVRYGGIPNKGRTGFTIVNVGNSTAMNIDIQDTVSKIHVTLNSSTLEKSEIVPLGIDTKDHHLLNENEIVISFQNINGEYYYVKESVTQLCYEIKEFKKEKYEY